MRSSQTCQLLDKFFGSTATNSISFANNIVSGIPELRLFYEILLTVEGFHDMAKKILAHKIFMQNEPTANLTNAEIIFLQANYSGLLQKARGVHTYLKGISELENKDCIYFKMPPTKYIPEFTNNLELLQKSIEQLVIHPDVGGKVEITGCDRGSIWLELFLGTTCAVTLVGSVAWSAAVIRKKYLEVEAFKTHVDELQIKVDAKKQILDAQHALIENLIEGEAKNLISKRKINHDPEYLGRVKYSIKELHNLLCKGAEIAPALTAPEEIKNLFPSTDHIMSIVSNTRQLETKVD